MTTFTPITISTFRASYADLQVGDQVLDARGWGGWQVLTITKLTPTQFACDSRRFKREDGYEIGGSRFHRADLPTPELLADINATAEEKLIRRTLGNTNLSDLPLATAKQVLALIESAHP